MKLTDRLSSIPGIGPTFAERLENLELFTVEDLLNHYPFRYDDFSKVASVEETSLGETVTLKGELWSIQNNFTRSRKVLTKALFSDGTSPIEIVWFNQPWLIKTLKPGDKLQVSGKVQRNGTKLSLVSPQWEKIIESQNTETINTGRLVPVYSETYGVTSKWFRAKIAHLLPLMKGQFEEFLPPQIQGNMIDLDRAIEQIHFPKNWEEVSQAKQRLAFNELFLIQLATQQKRLQWKSKQLTQAFEVPEEKLAKFLASLPFALTSAQARVIQEIIEDIKLSKPMNRLVQGEVGSGKTVVASVITYLAFTNNLRSLLMAPTEILAFQHYETLNKLLGPYDISVGIYTGSRKFTKSKPTRTNLAVSQDDKTVPDVIVGTHALLSDKLLTDQVGLVIVDEQQRFGVGQRTILRSKAKVPHFLSMTATPIPRTAALTLYGDLDLSIIDELPKNRQPIKTFVVPDRKRDDAYLFIQKKVQDSGDQVYIITPLIEESDTITSVKAATVEFERLKTEVFPELRVGILHGRLKPKEKEAVINQFKNHELDILVSTSVVEVGVDVPNATIMVIEGAERFGLAQLHQLRGRIGRGSKESFCLLFSSDDSAVSRNRLKHLEKTSNGLELANLDLKMRGSGDVFGTRQSGRWELKIASLSDLKLIEETRAFAKQLLDDNPTLDKYPRLQAKLQGISSDVMPD